MPHSSFVEAGRFPTVFSSRQLSEVKFLLMLHEVHPEGNITNNVFLHKA